MMLKTFLLATVFIGNVSAATVDEVLDKMEENENANTSKALMTMAVTDAGGRETVSELISYSADKGDKGLMVYNAPARIKGMKILTLNDGDDIWFFSARTGRVRKIASNQKGQSVNNSDFSYEDMSTSDRREDYTCKLLPDKEVDGTAHYTVEMVPKKKGDISYSRIIFYVDKKTYLPTEGGFYDEDGELWKKMYMKNPSKEGKYWNPESIEMHNVQKGSKTVLKTEKIEFDIELDRNMFSERHLKR
jgi:outer membrane lipoprotein-sorting protein